MWVQCCSEVHFLFSFERTSLLFGSFQFSSFNTNHVDLTHTYYIIYLLISQGANRRHTLVNRVHRRLEETPATEDAMSIQLTRNPTTAAASSGSKRVTPKRPSASPAAAAAKTEGITGDERKGNGNKGNSKREEAKLAETEAPTTTAMPTTYPPTLEPSTLVRLILTFLLSHVSNEAN